MERRQQMADGSYVFVQRCSGAHHVGKAVLFWKSPHHDHVVDGPPIGEDIDHPEVDVGSQTSVELDLTVAVRLASLATREVDKTEVNGLSKLVDAITDEDEQ